MATSTNQVGFREWTNKGNCYTVERRSNVFVVLYVALKTYLDGDVVVLYQGTSYREAKKEVQRNLIND